MRYKSDSLAQELYSNRLERAQINESDNYKTIAGVRAKVDKDGKIVDEKVKKKVEDRIGKKLSEGFSKSKRPDTWIEDKDKITKKQFQDNIASYPIGTYVKMNAGGNMNSFGSNMNYVKTGKDAWTPYSDIGGYDDTSRTTAEILRNLDKKKIKNIAVKYDLVNEGDIEEASVDEDEWKTMHGAHILIDTDGNIVAGGPEKFRKKKVDKEEVKDIKKNADAKSEKEAEVKKSDDKLEKKEEVDNNDKGEEKSKKERKSYTGIPDKYRKKFKDAKLDPKFFVNPTAKNKKEGFSTADSTLYSTDSGRSYDFNSVAMPVQGSRWSKWGNKGCVDILKETYGDKSASVFGVKSFDEIRDIKKLANALGTAVRNGLDMKPYKENFNKELDSRKEKKKEHSNKEYEKKKAEKEERIERVKVSRQKAIDSIDTNKRIRDKKGTKEAVDKALKFMKDYGDEYGTSKITNPNDGPGMFNFGSKQDNYRIFMGDYVGEIQKKSGLYGKEFRDFCYDLGINPKFMPSSH